ncbi:MAG TPA: HxsD-like protein [Nannocystaceae bacterium]|nr:HxsD-like protein [Nannocystaceae bacterium]
MKLRLHSAIYAGTAIDIALQRFAALATFERAIEGDYFVVTAALDDAARARKIAGELANFALGLTVEQGGPDR